MNVTMNKANLAKELAKTLQIIDDQMCLLDSCAELQGIRAIDMRLRDGSWPMTPLLVAKANVLKAIVDLGDIGEVPDDTEGIKLPRRNVVDGWRYLDHNRRSFFEQMMEKEKDTHPACSSHPNTPASWQASSIGVAWMNLCNDCADYPEYAGYIFRPINHG